MLTDNPFCTELKKVSTAITQYILVKRPHIHRLISHWLQWDVLELRPQRLNGTHVTLFELHDIFQKVAFHNQDIRVENQEIVV